MITFIRGLLVSGLAALALAACSSDMSSQQPTAMAGTEQPKLAFSVADIRIGSTFRAETTAPHVEALLPVTLEDRLADWARSNLDARGGSARGLFVITDASLVRTELDKDVGVPGLTRYPQTIRFDASIAATFEVLDEFGAQKAYTISKVTMGRTMTSFESDAARDILLRDLADAILKQFDAEMEKGIRANVSRFLL